MANYIQTLQAKVKEQDAKIVEQAAEMDMLCARITEFRVHLASDKFQGHAADGSLHCQIFTGDVHRWLDFIQHYRP